MGLNPLLVREFVRVNNDKVSPPTSETINGTIVKTSGGILAVRIDGSDSYIECDSTVSYNEGDRVIIDITDHTPTVTGNLTDKAVGEKTAKNVAQIAAGELVDSKIDQIVDEAAGSVIQQISGVYAEKTDTPKSVLMQYALSDSEIIPPSEGDWSTVAPTWEQGRYMWQRTVTIYVDDTESKPHRYIGEPTCISGAKGDPGEKGDKGDPGQDGQPGNPGVSIIAVTPIYFCTSSTEDEPTPPPKNTKVNIDDPKEYGKWNLQPAEWDGTHQVYFICSQIEYDDGSVDFSKVVKDSSLSKVTSEIIQQAGKIATKVDNSTYQTTITQLENSINQRVQKGDVVAEINAAIDPETGISKVQIEAGAINLNGAVTANENFKILEDGSVEAKNGNFYGNFYANSLASEQIEAYDGLNVNKIHQTYDGDGYITAFTVSAPDAGPNGLDWRSVMRVGRLGTSAIWSTGHKIMNIQINNRVDIMGSGFSVTGSTPYAPEMELPDVWPPDYIPTDVMEHPPFLDIWKNVINVYKYIDDSVGYAEVFTIDMLTGNVSCNDLTSTGIIKGKSVKTRAGADLDTVKAKVDGSLKSTHIAHATGTSSAFPSVDISSVPAGTMMRIEVGIPIDNATTQTIAWFSTSLKKGNANSPNYLYNVGGYYYSANYNASVFINVSKSRIAINDVWTKAIGGANAAVVNNLKSKSTIYVYTENL